MRRFFSFFRLFLAILLLGIGLSACGFQPLYAIKNKTPEHLAAVNIQRIVNEDGQKLHLLLEDRFYSLHPAIHPALWDMSVELHTTTQQLGLTENDNATRIRMIIKATINLKKTGDSKATFTTTERSVASYNVLADQYATYAAEQDATDRNLHQLAELIENRVALYLTSQNNRTQPSMSSQP